MEVKQEPIINFPKEECEIKVENIDVYDVEVSYSVKTEVKDELLESCSPNNDTHSNIDDANSIDSKTKAFYIEDIKLEEEDKPDIIPIENDLVAVEKKQNPPKTNFTKEMSTKGGKDTQQRRSDKRRGRKNNQAAKDSQNAFVLELGLTESSALAALDVPQSVRPGAVHISLLGANETIGNMLRRLSAVARRPLAMQLTQENQEIYRKVFQYVATSRVAAAQTQVPYAAGHILEYVGVFTCDQFRFIDGRCGTLPRPLAWTLANIGKFKMFGVDNVPAMPYQDANQADLYGLVSGGYFNIIRYVRLHGPGLPPIPEEDETAVRVISQFLPCITLDGNRRFNQRTVDFWQDQIPTQAEWMVFVSINASVREQGLAVTGFKVSTGTGSPSQTIRFPNLQTSVDVNHYYWLMLAQQNPTIRAAIVLRLGLDAHLPTALLGDRFIGNPKTAPFCGYATPVVYIDALLSD